VSVFLYDLTVSGNMLMLLTVSRSKIESSMMHLSVCANIETSSDLFFAFVAWKCCYKFGECNISSARRIDLPLNCSEVVLKSDRDLYV
jgi:hypothetical protein